MVILFPMLALLVTALLILAHARRAWWGSTPFIMLLVSSLVASSVSLMFQDYRALAAGLLLSVQAGLLMVLVLEGQVRWRSNVMGLSLVAVGGVLLKLVLLIGLRDPAKVLFLRSVILEQTVYTATFLSSVWLTAVICQRLKALERSRAVFLAFVAGTVAHQAVINLVFGFHESLAQALVLHTASITLAGVMIAVYTNTNTNTSLRSPEHEAYTALLRTVEALAGQSTQELWPRLLESAVNVVPGAQAGSLWVRHGAVFRMVAQRGFSDALIGTEVLEEGFLIWYGDHEGWERLLPRIKSGSTFRNRVKFLRNSFETDLGTFDKVSRTDQIRANLCLPIIVGSELLAYFNLDAFDSERAFDERSVEVARDYVLQATALLASSLERAALEARLQEFETLESITAALQTAQTSADIARRVALEMVSLLDSQHGCVMLVDNNGDSLVPLAGTGVFEQPGDFRVPRGQGVTWAAIRAREVIRINDVREEPRLFNPDAIPLTMRSHMTVPLFDSSGEPLGALVLARAEIKPYTETDRRAAQVIASVSASALERVRATERLEIKLRETQSLLSMAQLLEGNDPESLDLALEMVRQLAEADVVVFSTLEEGLYRPRVTAGNLPSSLSMLMSQGIDGTIEALSGMVVGRGIEIIDEPGHPILGAYGAIGIRSVYLIGVQTEGGIGGLALFRHTRSDGWTEPQHRLIDATTRMLGALVARLDRLAHFEASYEGALRAIGVALEARDRETAGHTDRVTNMAERIGTELGLSDLELRELRWGAYLHDIGKLAIPDAILFKPGKLDPVERNVIETHATIGHQLALNLPFLPDASRSVVRHHHERWDGQGYPDRLRGDGIPLTARIFAVCDVFDALISERPYKKAMSFIDALDVLREGASRGQFDPQVMTAFEIVASREWGLRPPGTAHRPQAVPTD